MEKSDYIKRIFELGQAIGRSHPARPHPTGRVLIPWVSQNLTMVQLRTLFLIARQQGMTSRDLANTLGVTPANITGVVGRLVRQGLVARRRNPKDRRVLLLRVTDKGQGMIAEMQEARTVLQDRMMSQLPRIFEKMSQEELSALVQGLSGFADAVSTIEADEE